MSPEFLLTAFIVCLAPGSTTLGQGLRAGLGLKLALQRA